MEQSEKKSSVTERHIQTVFLTIITALLIAGVNSLFQMKEQLVRMDERDKQKQESIIILQKGVTEINQDIKLFNNRLTIIEMSRKKD